MTKNVNALIALGFLVFCGFSWYQITQLPDGLDDFWSYGISYFPMLTTIVIAVLATILLIRSILMPEPNAKIATGKTLAWMVAFAVFLALYAALYERIGFLPSSFLFMIIGMLMLRERRIMHVVVIPSVIITIAYFGFTKLMMVALP